jgi:short-subunit dehydrogenase
MENERMSYRTALVTGASSGIGRGLALALAARGTHIVAAARRKAQLDSLVAEIIAAGGSAEALALDVAQSDATYEAVRALDARTPLDLVIANAGVGDATPARKLVWSRVKQQLDVNLTGACATLCGALSGMVERGTGHLVGIASIAGFRGLPQFAAYSASKAGLRTFLEGLRLDLHGSHVYVTSICPGFIKTEMTANNKGPMPFLLEADTAVKIILRAIDDKVAERAFPWPLVAALKTTKVLMPDSLFVAMNRRSNLGG